MTAEDEPAGSDRRATLATLAAVAALVGVVVVTNLGGRGDDAGDEPVSVPAPSMAASTPAPRQEAERLATMAPEEIAAEGVEMPEPWDMPLR